jgi:hypothetical protein
VLAPPYQNRLGVGLLLADSLMTGPLNVVVSPTFLFGAAVFADT